MMFFRQFWQMLNRYAMFSPVIWSVLSRLPIFFMSLGFILAVTQAGGSFKTAGLVTGGYTAGLGLFAPLIARLADAKGLSPVLLITSLIYPVAVVATLEAPTGTVWQLGFAVTAGGALPPTNAGLKAIWSSLPLTRRERDNAYTWEALLTEALVLGSPILLAALMMVGSAKSAVMVGAVVVAIGAAGLAVVLPRQPNKAPGRYIALSTHEKFWNADLVLIFTIIGLCGIPMGLVAISIPAMLKNFGSPQSAGLVYACWGIGSLVVGTWYGSRSFKSRRERHYPLLLLFFAGGLALPAVASSDATLALALAIGGAPIAAVSMSELAIMRTIAPPERLTETFTWLTTLTILGDSVGQVLGGFLLGVTGPQRTYLLAGAIAALTSFVAALAFKRRSLEVMST